jgi:hypothetical protein
LSTCGIEDYLFLYPVWSGNIQRELNYRATIRLPDLDLNEYYYFTHFAFYYRIYISNIAEPGDIQLSSSYLANINQSLSSDYFAFEPYINNDTVISTSMATVFTNRKYYSLELAEGNVNDVLGSGLQKDSNNRLSENTVVINFAPTQGTHPTLIVNNQSYSLYRSTGNGTFSPAPNRYFLNTSELNRSENAIATINADVADKSNISGQRYAYAAVFILVTGTDPNYTPIYSRPAYVGIFRLPE